jgi:hypothetical protein
MPGPPARPPERSSTRTRPHTDNACGSSGMPDIPLRPPAHALPANRPSTAVCALLLTGTQARTNDKTGSRERLGNTAHTLRHAVSGRQCTHAVTHLRAGTQAQRHKAHTNSSTGSPPNRRTRQEQLQDPTRPGPTGRKYSPTLSRAIPHFTDTPSAETHPAAQAHPRRRPSAAQRRGRGGTRRWQAWWSRYKWFIYKAHIAYIYIYNINHMSAPAWARRYSAMASLVEPIQMVYI